MSALPHIYTLTGNLLAEHTLDFRHWAAGATQRADRTSFQVGGKGINVSKMLTRLGAANTALCFTGGAAGAECEAWLAARGFQYRAFPTTTPTRTGFVIRSATQPETTFFTPDAAPDADAIRACAEFLDAQPAHQVLALCGSFPGWSSEAFEPLRDALARWLSRGCLVADVYGPPLEWLLLQPLDLLKLNAIELAAAGFGPQDPLPAGPLRWVVTDGARSIRLREGIGSEITLTPPTIREISPTGSGDVLFAAVLNAMFQRGLPLRAAVEAALPYAAANAAHPGVAEFPDPA